MIATPNPNHFRVSVRLFLGGGGPNMVPSKIKKDYCKIRILLNRYMSTEVQRLKPKVQIPIQ